MNHSTSSSGTAEVKKKRTRRVGADDEDSESSNRPTRACDNCRRKKSKCALERPTCSSCLIYGAECVYSKKKRKPGPRKGSVQNRTKGLQARLETLENLLLRQAEYAGQAPRHLSTSTSQSPCDIPEFDTRPSALRKSEDTDPGIESPLSQLNDALIINLPGELVLQDSWDPWERELPEHLHNDLLALYFSHVEPIYPMFRKDAFLEQAARNEIPWSLTNAMFALSARFSRQRELLVLVDNQAWRAGDVFAQRARSEATPKFTVNEAISLNDVKTAFLLSTFDNTRYPGRKAWYGAGNTTRLAYGCGLDQVDYPSDGSSSQQQYSDQDKEERRYLWWHIWKLDCFANIAAATPRTIDDDSMCTALVSTLPEDFMAGKIGSSKKVFLDNDISNPWDFSQKLANSIPGNWSNMYILANSIIHEAAAIRRLRLRSSNSALQTRQDTVENTLTAFRLALPPGFTNTVPMTCEANRPSCHRLRLEVLIQLQIAQIYLYLPVYDAKSHAADDGDLEEITSYRWQKLWHSAEEVVRILRDWPAEYFQEVDPMICGPFWLIHLILTLHRMLSTDADQRRSIASALDVLTLSVSYLSKIWCIAQIVLSSIRDLKKRAHIPATLKQVHQFLLHFKGPLNQKRHFTENSDFFGGDMNHFMNDTTFANCNLIQDETNSFWQQLEQAIWPDDSDLPFSSL